MRGLGGAAVRCLPVDSSLSSPVLLLDFTSFTLTDHEGEILLARFVAMLHHITLRRGIDEVDLLRGMNQWRAFPMHTCKRHRPHVVWHLPRIL